MDLVLRNKARRLLIECVVRARLQGEAEASALEGEEMDEDEDEVKDGEEGRKRQAHRREHGRSSRAGDDDDDDDDGSNNAGGMRTDTSRDRLQTARVNANGSAEQLTAFTFSSSGFERTSPQLPFSQHHVAYQIFMRSVDQRSGVENLPNHLPDGSGFWTEFITRGVFPVSILLGDSNEGIESLRFAYLQHWALDITTDASAPRRSLAHVYVEGVMSDNEIDNLAIARHDDLVAHFVHQYSKLQLEARILQVKDLIDDLDTTTTS